MYSLLKKLGVNVIFEQIYNRWDFNYRLKNEEWPQDVQANISYLLPFAVQYDKPIIHQIKNKEDSVNAMLNSDYFIKKNMHLHFNNLLLHYCPEILNGSTQKEKCEIYWEVWNQKIAEKALFSYNIEELDLKLVKKILKVIDFEVSDYKIRKALSETPTNTNTTKTGNYKSKTK